MGKALGGYDEEDARRMAAISETIKRGRNPLVEFIDAEIDKMIERFIKGSAPMWEGQNEQGRAFVGMSGASLVLTVSLVQFLSEHATEHLAGWLLPASWFAFAISVVAGILRHGWASRARGVLLELELAREEIRDALHDFDPGTMDLSESVEAAIEKGFGPLRVTEESAVRWHNRALMVSGWAFVGGAAALVAFAVLNVPW